MVPKELAKPQPPKLTDLSRSKQRSEWVSQGNHLDSYTISSESFRFFRGFPFQRSHFPQISNWSGTFFCCFSHTPVITFFYKGTKILSLEINIFWFENDDENWSGIYFEIHRAPQRYLLTCQANSALTGRFFGIGQQQL